MALRKFPVVAYQKRTDVANDTNIRKTTSNERKLYSMEERRASNQYEPKSCPCFSHTTVTA